MISYAYFQIKHTIFYLLYCALSFANYHWFDSISTQDDWQNRKTLPKHFVFDKCVPSKRKPIVFFRFCDSRFISYKNLCTFLIVLKQAIKRNYFLFMYKKHLTLRSCLILNTFVLVRKFWLKLSKSFAFNFRQRLRYDVVVSNVLYVLRICSLLPACKFSTISNSFSNCYVSRNLVNVVHFMRWILQVVFRYDLIVKICSVLKKCMHVSMVSGSVYLMYHCIGVETMIINRHISN